jgi:hypothetical protein
MQDFILDKTSKTPAVNLNSKEAVFRIEGRSIPENPDDFYSRITDWLLEYFQDPKEQTDFHFQFEYINSGSSKFIMNIFQIIKKFHSSGSKCQIHWYYEEDDENIQELGQHYQSTFNLPFKFVEIIL